MRDLRDRILRGIEAILKAKSLGRDTTDWENHLIELISEIPADMVKVRVGKFGFCTCSEDSGLCCGCWKIRQCCECIEREVEPEEEMLRQYKVNKSGVH